MTAFERHLAELVAGSDGGWSLWLAALAGLEDEIRESRLIGRERFDAYPRGELRRLLLAIEDLLRRADFAVEVRELVAHQVDDRGETDRIAEVLLRRAREVATEPVENFHLRSDYARGGRDGDREAGGGDRGAAGGGSGAAAGAGAGAGT